MTPALLRLSRQLHEAGVAYIVYNACRSLQARVAALWQSLRGPQKGNRYV